MLADLIGHQALVTLSIPERGVGRVQFEWPGGTHTATARSASNIRIEQGSIVNIDSVVAGEVVVSNRS